MKKYKYLVAGAAVVCALAGQITESLAQRRPNTRFAPYSSVSFGVGTSTYYGDLAGYGNPIKSTFTLPRWNVGIGYTRQFTPHFAARAAFTWARITGDDYKYNKNAISNSPVIEEDLIYYVRNLHFRNDIKEFALTGIYNFIEDGRNSNVRAKFTPYLFGGIALVAHSPQARTPYNESSADSSQRWVKLQPLHTEGQGQPGRDKPYSLVTAAIPVGIGFRYMINENFNVGVEIGYRYTFTDYLDDVGGGYAPAGALQGLAQQLGSRREEVFAARTKKHPNRYDVLVQKFQASDAATQAALSDLLTSPNQQRGADGILNDGYLLTNFSIHYIIPGKIKCPPIK
ncbi:DUF6089 family protein [Spirosoma soli]|uniref:DUF6089 family protein n=1 Tax=Spirosoma soli TaxID=1770529 RepID=A0ABW5MBH1_9BACT